MEEMVACFASSLIGRRNDSVFYDSDLWQQVQESTRFVPRSQAETDASLKQIVVYAIVKCGKSYLAYRRTPRGQEERLKSKHSIGIGGHVNARDLEQRALVGSKDKPEFLLKAVWREIEEEISLEARPLKPPILVCFINDDSNEVGKVHFGTVWILEVDEPKVALRREAGIGELRFMQPHELTGEKEKFESWSQLLIDRMERLEARG